MRGHFAFGLGFVDFHAEYADASGDLDRARADDSVHVRPEHDDHIVAALGGEGLLRGPVEETSAPTRANPSRPAAGT